MTKNKQGIAIIGLILITCMAAVQYVFLRNVPDTVSTFSFLFITNVIGLVILVPGYFHKLISLRRGTLFKGAFFALELTGFNVFLLMGSRHLDAVIISSVVSLYFLFITPILLLMGKKVNFFSGIATVIAIISLLLMFGVDTETLLSSPDIVYLVFADLFFAAYVVSVSVLGADEDSAQLTLSQMLFSAMFGLAGWGIESVLFRQSFSLPVDMRFWISAIFIGIFIRAVYGLVQLSCQKYVSALQASLVFSSEIIITLITNPVLCTLLNIEYTPGNIFQVYGGLLLIVATLMVDDTVMSKLGYGELQERTYVNAQGQTVTKSSVARKIIMTTLTFSMFTLVICTLTFLSAIYVIRSTSAESSRELGETASSISAEAMMRELEDSLFSQATDKALLTEQKLSAYSDSLLYAAAYAEALYRSPDGYPAREVQVPLLENTGIWAMQRTLANSSVTYDMVRDESFLLGNMEDVLAPIVENNDNIATIYLGTERGLLISYDPNSEIAVTDGEGYYEYRNLGWYQLGRSANGYAFTEAYQDGWGRGLTITCVAPFKNATGSFAGCIAMDILMSEMNAAMVNDGIEEPSVAALINSQGDYIASRTADPLAENLGNIFDVGRNASLRAAGGEILEKKNGIVSVGEGEDADYIAYATIASTDWTLCILTPVSSVIGPAIAIRENIDQNTQTIVSAVLRGIMNVIQSCLLLSAVILLGITLFVGRFSRRISDPLKTLEKDVQKISGGNLDSRTEVTTDDEIGTLAESFNHMADSLQQYIADLKEATAKEERIAGELNAATQIQADMLPRIFPPFPDRKEFDLFASMNPAKEVGGDFYDYFMVDDDHLALVMADVSGKGVPAALFMVISKTLLKNVTLSGQYEGPAEILSEVNMRLCEGNEDSMFVTVWLGILTISTGHLVSACAGHEYPVFYREETGFVLEKDRHGTSLGAIEGARYRETEWQMNPGDLLFLYTDGVPEATDSRDQLFGNDRMLAALNESRRSGTDLRGLLAGVRRHVDDFVGEAPQFDDLTMLCFEYRGQKRRHG